MRMDLALIYVTINHFCNLKPNVPKMSHTDFVNLAANVARLLKRV